MSSRIAFIYDCGILQELVVGLSVLGSQFFA